MKLSLFIEDYQKKLALLNSNNKSSNIELIKSNLERLTQIERQLAIESYRFVFIGEPGSGKTTTICNYLNLTKQLAPGDRFSGFELFDTASGRTTAFEVHYQRSDQTRFVIHPLEIAKQKALIQEFCEYNWRKAFQIDEKSAEEASKEVREGCSESDRIIRNMLEFSNDTSFQDYIKENYSGADEDEDVFLQDMIARVNLEERTCTEITYCADTEIRKWLKTVFNEINFGKRKDIAIPEQVDVFLNPNDLDYYMPDFIAEIIDTRGYDGGSREDLRTYIRSEDTISIILDKVESLPGERQRIILSDWIDSSETDIINRILLMIKDRDGALSRVNEANDDPEIGEQVKRTELSRSISANKLHYNESNTIFVDSYEGISLKQEYKIVEGRKKQAGKSVTDIDAEMRDYVRQHITTHFEQIIRNLKESLTKEAEAIRNDTEQLYIAVTTASEIEIIQDKLKETEHLVSAVRDTLNDEVEDSFLDCEQPFCSQFRKNTHWASARKTATLAWQGTWYRAEIYSSYMDFCEREVKKVSASKKEQIIGYIENLRKCDTASSEIDSFTNSCITRIELEYRRLIDNIRSSSKAQAEKVFDYAFWTRASDVERGSGYYDRLMKEVSKQMRRSNLSQHTSDDIQNAIDQFFSEIVVTLQNKSQSL